MIQPKHEIRNANNDEERCEARTSKGECIRAKAEGSNFCRNHGAAHNIKANDKKSIYNFQRAKFLALSDQDMAAFNRVKYDISAELNINRTMLQKYLDKIESFEDLQMHSNTITGLMERTQKFSESLLRTDQKLGILMSEEAALAIAQGLLGAVHSLLADHIEDDRAFSRAMESIGESFEKVLARNADSD